MLRDALRDKHYFDNAIIDTDDSLLRYETRMQNPEKLPPYGRMGGAAGLCRLTLNRLEYSYSRGDALTATKMDLVNLLKYRELQHFYADALPTEDADRRLEWERLSFSNYKGTLTWLAFSVSVGAGQDYLNKLFQLADNAGLDILFDQIAVKLGDANRPVGTKVLYAKPYQLLLDALNAGPTQQNTLMNKFMDAWYPACVKNGFYETHNITNNFGYAGYWCFEAALVTLVFKLDDTGYRNHKYYPAALVHGD
jgi:hypothetical protein